MWSQCCHHALLARVQHWRRNSERGWTVVRSWGAWSLQQQPLGSPSSLLEETADKLISSSGTSPPAPHERTYMIIAIIWVGCISLISFADDAFSHRTSELIVGVLVNFNLVFFYGAPLSTIATVLKTRNSASIHIRTMVTNTLNGTFWYVFTYYVPPCLNLPYCLSAWHFLTHLCAIQWWFAWYTGVFMASQY